VKSPYSNEESFHTVRSHFTAQVVKMDNTQGVIPLSKQVVKSFLGSHRQFGSHKGSDAFMSARSDIFHECNNGEDRVINHEI